MSSARLQLIALFSKRKPRVLYKLLLRHLLYFNNHLDCLRGGVHHP